VGQSKARAPAAPSRTGKTASLDGNWLGILKDGTEALHLRLAVKTSSSGQTHFTLYSIDRGNVPILCANMQWKGKALSFDVPAVKGHWGGKVSADRKKLSGIWNQGTPLPLNFSRQSAAQTR
jgi:serine-type D-Ala-D-Ala carboxypeptidase/endopeptidase